MHGVFGYSGAFFVRLLLEEGLGYHASIHPELGSNGASAIYALAGCLDFDDTDKDADRRCGENETEIHALGLKL